MLRSRTFLGSSWLSLACVGYEVVDLCGRGFLTTQWAAAEAPRHVSTASNVAELKRPHAEDAALRQDGRILMRMTLRGRQGSPPDLGRPDRDCCEHDPAPVADRVAQAGRCECGRSVDGEFDMTFRTTAPFARGAARASAGHGRAPRAPRLQY